MNDFSQKASFFFCTSAHFLGTKKATFHFWNGSLSKLASSEKENYCSVGRNGNCAITDSSLRRIHFLVCVSSGMRAIISSVSHGEEEELFVRVCAEKKSREKIASP